MEMDFNKLPKEERYKYYKQWRESEKRPKFIDPIFLAEYVAPIALGLGILALLFSIGALIYKMRLLPL